MGKIMIRLLRMEFLVIAAVLLAGGLHGWLEAGEKSSYPTVGRDLEPLRTAFNANPDHVRAILLASPT